MAQEQHLEGFWLAIPWRAIGVLMSMESEGGCAAVMAFTVRVRALRLATVGLLASRSGSWISLLGVPRGVLLDGGYL